jgi:hypothetical protein
MIGKVKANNFRMEISKASALVQKFIRWGSALNINRVNDYLTKNTLTYDRKGNALSHSLTVRYS